MSDTPFYDLDTSIGFLTITANRMMSSYFRRKMQERGIDLTAEQWGVLAMLWNKSVMAQDEIARLACVEKSSMSRVLDGMERKGLVLRKRDPADARRKILAASEATKKHKELCREIADGTMGKIVEGISEEDLDTTIAVLQRLKINLRDMLEETPGGSFCPSAALSRSGRK